MLNIDETRSAVIKIIRVHKLIATATACTTFSRAIASAIFSAINVAAFNAGLKNFLPEYIAQAASAAGQPAASLLEFIEVLSKGNTGALAKVPGITPMFIAQGTRALQQAFADSLRIVFITATPFEVISCITSWCLGDLRETINFRVDTPAEELHAKQDHYEATAWFSPKQDTSLESTALGISRT